MESEMSAQNTGPSSIVEVDVRADGVAVVEFSNGRNNFLTYELVDRLATVVEALADTPARAVVLRTASKHFCAGADFGGRRSGSGTAHHIFDVVPRLFRQPLPMVAAVGGAATGAGLGLALVSDFRVAAASAYFAAPFTRLGISQGFALSLTLPRAVGAQPAAELVYTGRRVPAEEALAIGLCDRLAERDLLDEEAIALASAIATSAPLALGAARRILRADLVAAVEETLRIELAEQQPLYATEDFREGVQAARERRRPNFRGV
jgi:enoyl-CoA hydratase/carnithine racemase